MRIGPYPIENPVILAPMAGVTDLPFRQLCLELGAGLAVSEMLSSNPQVWATKKSQDRMGHADEPGVKAVQIAGSEPELMAAAAVHNVEHGAQIIDINMGCPAKKVNKKLAGSALLQYPKLVEAILTAVVAAVDVPVTLKIRTGWTPEHRNGVTIAQIAEQAGIQSLAVHGRTRACMYKGHAEYDTIKAIKAAVSIPVVANGDITTPEKAREVLAYTGADAIMIGRGAQGNPWLFREIAHFLATGEHLAPPTAHEVSRVVQQHVKRLHAHYGDFSGVRIARKHVGWYLQQQQPNADFRQQFLVIEDAAEQLDALANFFVTVN
ncbi:MULTISPECIES: tRNA dihydrouridine synthase DusB [Idiomarinaceae]|nr:MULTISPECIES: tRNA dihydrouridine synthase DusB [Idiomarinaceae]MDT7526756.1 tRNA dihydrouridine synthase DusB [Pseudidiomarina sp. GXY010]MDX1525921.1 tRNA dihydrouridine synthase DusB [Pseudidiomarina maritima]MRJ43108.1 tRNA dihydrouridine synthase DusB [Idiomarina sp. FeN1]NCU58626.1 tRNA dihydrouridine synthase DusB [Idiomarina sp. FenA--70]NCU61323.1 tRNA dihydrouridine synthase DusB [Idiomarina sp. FenBw--71]